MLARAVAARPRRGAGAAGRRGPLLQRANDKFAVTFTTDALDSNAELLRGELAAIHQRHRRAKTQARAQLDIAHRSGVANLEQRQEQLAQLALPIVSADFNAKLLDKAGLSLTVPAAPAPTLVAPDDARKVALAVYNALLARAQDAVAAKLALPDLARNTGAEIDKELAKVASSVADGAAIAAKARGLVLNGVQKYGVTIAERTVPPSRSSQFNGLLGDVLKRCRQKDFKVNDEVNAFQPGERAYVEAKILGLRDKASAPPLPDHPYAHVDTLAAENAKRILLHIDATLKDADELMKRSAAFAGDVRTTTTEHARHHIADPLVAGYEKGYLASGMDLAKLKSEWVQAATTAGFTLTFEDRTSFTELVLVSKSGAKAPVGRLYVDDQRFRAAPVASTSTSTTGAAVFIHVESGGEYVRDASDLFVRRFVSRCLNDYDNPKGTDTIKISVDPREKKGTTTTWGAIALGLPAAAEKTRDEEIWAHQRKKELQGGSPFVSFTTSKHAIFGSTAKYFEDPQWGVATVDLAQVPKANIVDTHQKRAYTRITGRDTPQPDMPFRENDDTVERNTAVRDAMRTRELVVIGSLPANAIVSFTRYEWNAASSTLVPKKAYARAAAGDAVTFT